MYVGSDVLGRQIAERFPVPAPYGAGTVIDDKLPLIEWDMFCRSGRQDRKIGSNVLPGRQLRICGRAPAGKAT